MKYNFSKIEKKWQAKWLKTKLYEPNLKKTIERRKPFYNLMMFPYPSAEGLHVGNMYAFTGADVYGRFKRMQGYDVFEPIGLDGFGIHSENYALKIGTHPAKQAKISEKRFYKQLQSIGNGFAWNERLETYDPEYYKWTQWIFIQLFKAGLAYRKKQPVNWCASCKTVLADEQVESGKCERCGNEVIKKELEQWFFRITKYADKLLKNLEKIDWTEKVKIAQKSWIGKSEGAEIKFPISNFSAKGGSASGGQFSQPKADPPKAENKLTIFTTRPDTIFGATFMVVSPQLADGWIRDGWSPDNKIKKYIADHLKEPNEDVDKAKEKTGVFSGINAVNPANKEKIPIWIADYVLGDVGMGAIMAVPAHDKRDFEFAKKYNLPMKMVVCPHYPAPTCPILDEAYLGGGLLVDSGKFTGINNEEAKKKITDFLGGELKTKFRLRDWLISRQRYWGPPIPMIFCEKCNWQPVPEKELPVKLPAVKDFRPTGTGVSPLALVKSFYETQCPKCGAKARRETDVSDTFLDSAWYYMRYIDPKNKKGLFDKKIGEKWLPVNMYIGGAEHSVLHLLYVRFLAMALKDIGVVDFSAKGGSALGGEEPFPKFRAHGLVIKDGAKMSKSKGNIVNPDEYVKNFGADALRMYLMFLAPFEQGGDFRDQGILGITRFLERVWKMGNKELTINNKQENKGFQIVLNKAIKKITEDIENLQYNTAISQLMILLNAIEEEKNISHFTFHIFLKLLAPFAPHITEELWQNTQSTTNNKQKKTQKYKSIHKEPWPVYDPKFLVESEVAFVIQVNGKIRGIIKMSVEATEAEIKNAAMEDEKIKNYLKGSIEKVIFVPKKLINFVIK